MFQCDNLLHAKEINRDNIALAIDETIIECVATLEVTRDEFLIQDLTIAVEALEGIKSEPEAITEQRPKGLRTGLFIRYALDANDQLAMDSTLKEKVVRIEDIYKRL